MRYATPSGLCAALLSLSSLSDVFCVSVSVSAQTPSSLAPSEIRIVSTEFKFSPQSTKIMAGRPVIIVLDNREGETEHGIFLPTLGVRIFARAGEVAKHAHLFEQPGEYEFVCDLPGHMEAGMTGKFIITSHEDGKAKQLVGSAAK